MWTMKCDMSKEKLMDIITKASFAMDDVKLFLDTHPNCMEALEYYHKAKKCEKRRGRCTLTILDLFRHMM